MVPEAVRLHRKTKMLELVFSGERFAIEIELLRVYSPSSKVHQVSDLPVSGKKYVGARKLERVGNYAIRLYFDDGHHTGLYSLSFLHKLAVDKAAFWQRYLAELDKHNLSRLPVIQTG